MRRTQGGLNFAPGVTEQNISITILNDFLVEGNETFRVTLLLPAANATIANNIGVVTILDNDFENSRFSDVTSFFVPPHFSGGDRDFGGNGPDVSVEVTLFIDGNSIMARVFMDAIETKSNFTRARGGKDFGIFRHVRPIRKILSTPTFPFRVIYRDTDHAVDRINFPSGLVKAFRFVGDTSGPESGTKTGVATLFHTIRFIDER